MSNAQPVLPLDKPIGHNSAGDPAAVREDFEARVELFLKGWDVWSAREVLDDELAPRARDFEDGLKKLKRQADAARKVEKQPHMDAAKAVDDWWGGLAVRLDKMLGGITARLGAYQKVLDARRREEEAAAQRERLAREAEAEAARKAAAHATSESQRIAAEARAEEAARLAADAAREEKALAGPARIQSATGLANAKGVRKEWTATVADHTRAALHYRHHPEMLELIERLALRALREAPTVEGVKQVPEIPGVEFAMSEVYK